MRLLALSLLLLSAGVCAAAPPVVPKAPVLCKVGDRPAVVRVEVPKDAEFQAAPAFAAESCLWFPGETVGGVKSFLVQPYTAGVFRVIFWSKGDTEYAVLVIDASAGPAPPPTPIPPGPTPGPDDNGPKPPPTPVVPQAYYVVVVEETGLAVAERGAFFADAALAARMQDKGHRFRVVDQNVVGPDGKPPADVARFLTAAAGKTLPRAFLVDQKGKAVWSGDLPKAPAALVELLQKYGG